MSRLLGTLIVCAVLTSCATVQPGAEQARLEVEQASDRFWATRVRGDASAFASQFTNDGIFMVPGLADSAGRNAIQELAQIRFASAKISDFDIHRREIEVSGDSAHELGWYSETTRPAEESGHRMHGRYLLVWQRGSGNVWRVHRYVYSFSGAEPLP